MIISLAGHVDHGKTSLVNAITGVMTDRLKEEAARGLTIDLGFAYLKQPQHTLGFVDVPGHQRFIHNMVAGVSAHQCALLVIAADDGPMPQTQEHLNIMQVLGLQQGIVALTKIDRVGAERVQQLQHDVRTLTQGTFLQDAPIVPVSSISGIGVDTLVEQLNRAAGTPSAATQANPRLAIDRAFTLKGQGVVVTGTLLSGEIQVDDELYLFPEGQRVRVRSLHVQDAKANSASSGDRCAVNISGGNIALTEVKRGNWLMANPPTRHSSFVVQLQVLDSYPRPLKHWTAVHLYHGTTHSIAQLSLLEHSQLAPGTTGLSELICQEPLNAKRGDRLVLRDYGQDQTIGGASIVDNQTWQGRRRAPQRLSQLFLPTDPSHDNAQSHLAWALANGGIAVATWQTLWDLNDKQSEALLANAHCLVADGNAIALTELAELSDTLLNLLQQPTHSDGLQQDQLDAALTHTPSHKITIALQQLLSSKKVVSINGRYQLPKSQPQLTPPEASLLKLLQEQLDCDQPPSLGDISKRTGKPLDQLKRSVKPLAAKGVLVIVSDSRVFLPKQFNDLANLALRLQNFSVKDFRDASGLGRNLVIEVLERMDAKGFTRRNGNERQVVGDMSRLGIDAANG